MEDLYDRLDNYRDESTIAELREENKELKLKLKEYAATLDKLQKEFDILVSEHKKLELNYSTLLKTARSEIERKTVIITKLNIEKDEMVLKSIQNKNSPFNRRKNKQINNRDASNVGKPQQAVTITENTIKPNLPNQTANESRIDSIIPSENGPSTLTNTQARLLDLVNKTVGNPNINSAYNVEAKENIRFKDGTCSARISMRRKSMPVLSMDCAKFSTDEEDEVSTGSSKEFVSKGHPELRNLDKFPHDKPHMQDIPGHHDYLRENQRSRRSNQFDIDKYRSQDQYESSQRYKLNHSPFRDRNISPNRRKVSPDRIKGSSDRRRCSPDRRKASPDRRKASPDRRKSSPDRRKGSPDRRKGSPVRRRGSPDRRRGSPDRRRISPDRNKQGIHNHIEEFYLRQEHDWRRRLVSPPREKYHDYKLRSQNEQRSNERNHSQDFDRYPKSRHQDKFTMKHKISHDYEESSNKRMRIDSKHKHEDRRQVVPELLDSGLHNMSCQSPEFSHSETQPAHQIREIKLNASATAELDDPRLSSKKYALKNHDGRAELFTVESVNIDVKVIDTSDWKLAKKMKMPEALLTKPVSTGIPNDLLQKPMSSNKPVEFLHKPVASDKLHDFVDHATVPSTMMQKSESTVMSNALEQKPMKTKMPDASTKKLEITDRPHATYLHDVHNPMTSNMPDVFIQKTENTKMPQDFLEKPVGTVSPDALIKKPIAFDITHMAQKPGDDHIPDVFIQKSDKDTDMPDNLIKKPMSADDLIKEIYMDIENPMSNISMESGEINDFDDTETLGNSEVNEKNTNEKTIKQVVKLKDKNVVPMLRNDYKIPKKSTNTTNISKSLSLNTKMPTNNTKLESKMFAKIYDTETETTKTSKRHDRRPSQNKRKHPKRRSSEYQNEFENYITTKEIIGDLELSDDSNDNINVQMKQTPVFNDKEDSDMNPVNNETGIVKTLDSNIPEQKDIIQKSSLRTSGTVVEQKSKEITVKDSKKPTSRKKSSKVKETNEPSKTQDTPLSISTIDVENTSKEPENIDTSLSIDQLVKMKKNITKELLEKDSTSSIVKPVLNHENITSITKEPSLSVDKPVKKKEKILKVTNDDKDTALSTNKPVKKKESKTKKPNINKDISAVDKTGKKKENIPKVTFKNIDAPTVDGQVKNIPTKDTKFSELFGDSSSLVSPEDLGLVPTVEPRENYVAIFEDAQDAIDMNVIRAPVESYDASKKAETQINFDTNLERKTSTFTVEPKLSRKELSHVESTPIQNMYQNLQPEISPKEKDTVKTVIISTGTQSQCAQKGADPNHIVNKSATELHVMQCVKPTVVQNIAMQALATSTPHKIWQQNVVQAEADPKIPNSTCESNESRESVTITEAIDNSASKTNASQTNEQTDEPDMTIFVKRRRRVIKKK